MVPGANPGDAAGHVALHGLVRRFGRTVAVDGVSLALSRGEFVALLGPSGCGKTTTLRLVAGLETPDDGRVVVDGRDVTRLPPHRRRMGVVFQSYALFPHMSAAGNVAFGLEMHGLPRAERRARVADALALVGLSDLAARRPRQLSGGQQQRIALARALAIRPDVLLLDEPLSALDAKLREELRGEIRAIQRRVGATALFVTHDQSEALAMADRVAVMEHGRIVQCGPPEAVFERPETPFVATFVGRSARFEGTADAYAVLVGRTTMRIATPASGAVRLFVRPHRIRFLHDGGSADNALDGRVAAMDYTGDVVQVAVDTAVGRVPVEAGTAENEWRRLSEGTPVRIGWRAADTLCFPA